MEKSKKQQGRDKLWAKRKLDNVCVYCGTVPAIEGKAGCDSCLERKVKGTVAYAQRHKERTALYRKQVKKLAIDKYGGKCACCGITELMFLTIDHINEDGGKERKEMGGNGRNSVSSTQMHMKLIREDLRNDLQILCFNCNLGRNMNGGVCPHHKPSPESYEYEDDLRTKREFNIGCKIEWPSDEDLVERVNNSNYSAVGRTLGVHGTAVKYRLQRRDLLHLITK